MARVYLGLRAEVPPQRERILEAIRRLKACGVKPLRISPWFSDPSLNNGSIGLAVEAETTLSPRELFFICQGVERILGKDSADPLTPDPIEISIVLYEDLVMNEGELRIPYPHLLKRGVVLAALAELVPEVKHPVLGRTIWELLDELPPERRPIRSGEITSW